VVAINDKYFYRRHAQTYADNPVSLKYPVSGDRLKKRVQGFEGSRVQGFEGSRFKVDELVKSRELTFFVIPAKAGIQQFQ